MRTAPDPITFERAYRAATSVNDLAARLGCHYGTARKWAHGYGMDVSDEHWQAQASPSDGGPSESDMIHALEGRGYVLVKQATPQDRKFSLETQTFDGIDFTIGVVSDTHLCSKYQQLTHLNTAYDYFASTGIDTVFHAGDVLAGNGRVYKGQMYELHTIGADEQVAYAVDKYPFREGITTHVIAGNHDLSWVESSGMDIVERIALKRPDFDYLGWYSADVTMHGVKINLHHGEGGVSYARSYKLQRYIEQIAPEEKPHVLIEGHFHVTNVLEMYRNVNARMAGCFESQTPYLRRKRLYPEIGFYVLTIRGNETGVVKVKAEWIPFYVPLARDF